MEFLLYPVATEKAINMIEKNNVITYVVKLDATSKQVKDEFEKAFNVKVEKVNLAISPTNVKKAYIKLGKEYKASDIALKLKLV
ncbi:MAG: 50S ribosomal protein L23 [Candidatus Micrarchaeia archaeon]|jgi:large subunit ribosomal protein L23